MGLQESVGEVNDDLLRAEKEQQDRKMVGEKMENPFFISTNGTYQIRILPPHKDMKEQTWLRRIVQYYVPTGVKKGVYVTVGEDGLDPITQAKEAIIATENPELMEKAKKMGRSFKYLVNALVISAPPGVEFEVGKVYTIKLVEMIKRQLIELDQEKSLGWNGLWQLDTGVNITISRSGAGLDTTYMANPHGGGRTNVFDYLKEHNVDPNSVELHNLELACPVANDEALTSLLQTAGFISTPEASSPPPAQPVAMSEAAEDDIPAPPSLPSAE